MKNPIANALFAALYIVGLVHLIEYFIGSTAEGSSDSIFVPMAMLALFVLSAAVMGYLFILPPAELYFSGQKSEGIRLFLATVAVFAVFTGIFVTAMFYEGIKRSGAALDEPSPEASKEVEAFGHEL